MPPVERPNGSRASYDRANAERQGFGRAAGPQQVHAILPGLRPFLGVANGQNGPQNGAPNGAFSQARPARDFGWC